MRHWQFWWRTLLFSTQHNPPESIEHLMILLTLALGLSWVLQYNWQYLVLSASFAIGAATSMWIRETLIPSPRPRSVMIMLVLLLFSYSLYAFATVLPDIYT
ncbi:MAG TPA: hypothetical protein DEG17_16670 [Cyanobacteria bacterium UBA11149]|nr:hypothetical protein [Cyanobacteria bacterium UBA11367]HBE58431.1 hypothetical protein [Cyanobacteria bacterium UBA11366]HBK63747.1 hypothetical protein [Cyanobacteria bacterium UBA11166]HBR74096.1 hypothetical protein [Cyanobacteria bacterium UBA11159]HBS70081.1 hypothetical protein [Cyanobacteria bacterium UBA11153]HBW90456.1 hypothetical protein [Cyanobacteria bacterium UBA11149]HCA94472.1 hypothetical protein [Cyanobacteria bacterium UBA9226]